VTRASPAYPIPGSVPDQTSACTDCLARAPATAISNSEGASSRGGKKSGSGSASKSDSRQGGTTQQKKAAGRKGGKAASKS